MVPGQPHPSNQSQLQWFNPWPCASFRLLPGRLLQKALWPRCARTPCLAAFLFLETWVWVFCVTNSSVTLISPCRSASEFPSRRVCRFAPKLSTFSICRYYYRNSGRGRHFRHARGHPQHRKHAARVATRSEICFFKRERWLAFDCTTIYFVARRPHAAVLGPVELST